MGFPSRSLFFSQINIAAETAIGSSDYLLLYAASVRQRYGDGSMGRVPDVLVSPQKRWKRQEVLWGKHLWHTIQGSLR